MKKQAKSKKTSTQSENKKEYKATLKVMGAVYTSEGSSVSDAISNLEPKNCKGKGILTIEKGENRKDKVITPVLLFRLFGGSKIGREIGLKNAGLLFDL